MSDVSISPRYKKLYARVLRLGVDQYLTTTRCGETLIEYDIDGLWSECLKFVLGPKNSFGIDFSYANERSALGLFIEQGFARQGWIEGFIALLEDFCYWSDNSEKDLNPVVDALEELGYPAPLLRHLTPRGPDQLLVSQAFVKGDQQAPPEAMSKKQNEHSSSRPRVFIGSSSEALRVAEAIHSNLDLEFECTVWNQGVFGLSTMNLESLEQQIGDADFAVLVVSPDDTTESRGNATASPRDNVIFELGLFMGALGRKRTFVVQPRNKKIKIPSDLLGVVVATYEDERSDGNLRAATGSACIEIKNAIHSFSGKAK